MAKEDLKEKFKRVFKKTPRVRFEKLNIVFESIKNKQEKTKLPSTISEISIDTSLKRDSVGRYVKHLEKSSYIKRNRKYTPPFLKVTDKKGNVDFIYGKDNRDKKVEEEQNKVVKVFKSIKINLSKKLKQALRFITGNKNYNSKFLFNYNELVDFLWKKNKAGDFVKLEIGSGANRFFVY